MSYRPTARFAAALIAGLVLISQVVAAGEGGPAEPGNAGRIVAIGDVHGSFEGLRTILRTAGLTDSDDRWIGGDAVLVQTGDLTDRGEEVKGVFDLLRRLQREAAADGGKIVTLLGNHEIANLLGVFSPTSTDPEVFSRLVGHFADGKSEKRRREAFKAHQAWVSRYPGCGSAAKEEWMQTFPLGFVEYVEAISANGDYGRWLRGFPVVERLGDTIFLHGGLSSALETWGFDSLGEINDRIRDEIALHDEARAWLQQSGLAVVTSTLAGALCAIDSELYRRTEERTEDGEGEARALAGMEEIVDTLRAVRGRLPSTSWLANHPDGPLWFRGYAFWTAEEGYSQISALLERWSARHFVVGHTPQRGTIKARFDGAVFLIDTALVFGAAAGGGPAALEILDGDFSALYPERRVALWSSSSGGLETEIEPLVEELPWKDSEGKPLPFASPEDVEGFLKSASVVSSVDIPLGVTKPKQLVLERDGVRARAAFRFFHEEARRKQLAGGPVMGFRDSYANEVAAYQVARLLGMTRVPPAVPRTVDGVDGSVQLWVEDAMMEKDRRETGALPPDSVHLQRQFYDMLIFDNVIGNFDRNQTNILIDEDWNLWLIDHTRAFRSSKSLPKPDGVVRCSRALWRAIQQLDLDSLDKVLAPLLSPFGIKAILARRDRVVEILEEKLSRLDESRVLFDWDDPSPDVRVFEEPTG